MLHYKIHEEIRLIKGAIRGIAYDLNRSDYDFLPNLLIDELLKNDGQSFNILEKALTKISNKSIAQEHIDFLLDKEYIFFMEKEFIPLFSKLDLTWKIPAKIYSAIIDVGQTKFIFQHKVVEQLEDLGCKHLIFRFSKRHDLDTVSMFLERYNTMGFHSISVWMSYPKNLNIKNLEKFCKKHPKIVSISLFNCVNKRNYKLSLESPPRINCYLGQWEDRNECLVNIKNFRVNITLFTEALIYHPYFNQKIYIDSKGLIRNSPNTPIIGNVKEVDIETCLSKKHKLLWAATKDKTAVCKDCEFRYMCCDNRIPIKLKNGEFYFENDCNYNPYIAKWKKDKLFKPLSDCGQYNKEHGFIPDFEKITKINRQLWTD